MIDREITEIVTECLQDYPANITRIEVLKKDVEVLRMRGDVKGHNFVKIPNDSTKKNPHDPVFEYITQIDEKEREIARLVRITEPITKMIQDLKSPYSLESSLNSDFIKILGLDFFGRNPIQIILSTTGWSRASYFRKKKQLLELACNYLGY